MVRLPGVTEMARDLKAKIDDEAVMRELDRILSSSVFSAAKRSRMFLRYAVERSLANAAPKEFEIAVEVLGRGSDYDPDVDATVRVEASRLRHRLREYYDTVGKADAILIDIPKGGYAAVFLSREVSPPGRDAASAFPEQTAGNGTGMHAPESKSPAEPVQRAGWFRYLERMRSSKLPVAAVAGIAVTMIVIGMVIAGARWNAQRRLKEAGPIRSLAVLPLQNLSGNAGQEYFADGMTDALITELAHIPNLRVVSRTSVMQEKSTQKSLRQIASELDVDAIVEGSVVRSGDRVRITAQLIDARDDRHLWAESYEEQMSDVLTLQDKLVREIALHAQAALGPSLEKSYAKQIDPAAYDVFLRGLYALNQREIPESVAYFQQAVARDSSYAAAYAGLAEALTTQGVSGGSAQPAEQIQALAAAKRAVALNPNSGEAYAALGLVEMNYGKDWAAAGRDLEKGIALSPSDSLAEMQYSIYLDAMGRPDEAVAAMRRAVQLDPRSFLMNRHLGAVLYFARHYDEALSSLNRAIELEPERSSYARPWITRSYEMLRRPDQAENSDLLGLAVQIPADKLAPLHLAFEKRGWKVYLAKRTELIAKQPANGCALYEVGEGYVLLGNADRAFPWLARGVEAGCYWADSLPVDPILDGIRNDPRFPGLLRLNHLEAPRT
jgi:TolB-like protein/Flp pilus assembly protein TadD